MSSADGTSLRIPSELPARELVEAVNDLLDKWRLAGVTEDTIAKTHADFHDMDRDTFWERFSSRSAEIYTAALFPDDWQSNPDIAILREDQICQNCRWISINLFRFDTNRTLGSEVTTIVSATELPACGDQRIITYTQDCERTSVQTRDKMRTVFTARFDISDGTARLIALKDLTQERLQHVSFTVVRTWAQQHGYQVADRGRVPQDIIRAWAVDVDSEAQSEVAH